MVDNKKLDDDPNNSRETAKQMNEALQGIDGRVSGTIGAEMAHDRHIEEKKKKHEDALKHVTMSSTLEQAYQAIEEEIAVVKETAQKVEVKFEAVTEITLNVMRSITEKNLAANDTLIQHEKDLAEMKAGDHPLVSAYEGDKDMQGAQIALKEAEIRNAKMRVELLTGTIVATTAKYGDAKTSMEEANETISQLKEQKRMAESSSDPKAALKNIELQMTAAKVKLQEAETAIAEVEQKNQQTEAIAEVVNSLEGVSMECGATAEYELGKAAHINAKTDLGYILKDAITDNQISKDELTAISEKMEAAGINNETKINFTNTLIDSGIKIEGADGKMHGGEDSKTIIQEQLSGQLTLNTPKYPLAEYDKAENDALAVIQEAKLNGLPLSKANYDKIAATPGMENKIDEMMLQNGIKLEGATPTNSIRNAPAHKPDDNGIIYTHASSFADSKQFAATNAANSPTASYNEHVDSHTDNTPSLTVDKFGVDPTAIANEKDRKLIEEEEQRIALEQAQNNRPNPTPHSDGSGQMA